MIVIKKLETELFNPVKKHFESLGYKVNAEVMHCDMTAVKDDRLLVIELKISFNMTVLYQAIDRQKITNEVYIAIPKPTRRMSKNFSKMIHITQCLNLGLITVALKKNSKPVEIVCEPIEGTVKKNNRRSRMVINEIRERKLDNNLGGSSGEKITTAYTEKALRIAVVLNIYGSMSASALIKEYDCCKKSWHILYDNYYGWFIRSGVGQYALSEKGTEILSDKKYMEHIAIIKEEVTPPEPSPAK